MTAPALNTPARVINQAYFDAGYLERGQDPDSEQLADGMNRLNDLMNLWQIRDGLKLWLQFDLAVTLVAGQNLYTIGPSGNVIMTRPTRVLPEGYYRDSNSNDRPLFGISRNEWNTLSLKSANIVGEEGTVVNFFVDKQVATMNVYFWQTPSAQAATGQAHILIQQQQSNVVSLNDTMQFGPEWFLALQWGLANEISTGQPSAVQAKCQFMADEYYTMLTNWDVEDASTILQPDPRTQYVANRFV